MFKTSLKHPSYIYSIPEYTPLSVLQKQLDDLENIDSKRKATKSEDVNDNNTNTNTNDDTNNNADSSSHHEDDLDESNQSLLDTSTTNPEDIKLQKEILKFLIANSLEWSPFTFTLPSSSFVEDSYLSSVMTSFKSGGKNAFTPHFNPENDTTTTTNTSSSSSSKERDKGKGISSSSSSSSLSSSSSSSFIMTIKDVFPSNPLGISIEEELEAVGRDPQTGKLRKLTPAQLRSIRETGTFSVPSSNTLETDHVWKLANFLQLGKTQTNTNWVSWMLKATTNLLIKIPLYIGDPFHQSLWNGVKSIKSAAEGIIDCFIGTRWVRDTYSLDEQNKYIAVERARYLTDDLVAVRINIFT